MKLLIREKLASPFPFFLNDDRKNFLLIAGISLFVIFFLGVFSPFQESYPFKLVLAYAVVCLLVLAFNILVLPKIFPAWFDNANWDLKKYILFKVFLLLSVAVAITVTNIFLKGWAKCQPISACWMDDLLHVGLVGIFPMVTITLIVKNSLTRANQKAGEEATNRLKTVHEAPPEPRVSPVSLPPQVTIQTDTQEQFQLLMYNFLMAEASDNYTELYWKSEKEVCKKLLRITLKNLEPQIVNHHILRCHRSFIVNLDAVQEVTGNASGYKLIIEVLQKEIPVSRSLGKEVLQRINSL